MRDRVFVDTSAYYALTDPHDQNHTAAAVTVQRLALGGNDLYTTNYVLAETHGLLLGRLGRDIAERVLDQIVGGTTRIIRANEGDERHAREIIHQQRDKDYSLVDAISFAIMERLHLHTAWTYDQHFVQHGYRVLI